MASKNWNLFSMSIVISHLIRLFDCKQLFILYLNCATFLLINCKDLCLLQVPPPSFLPPGSISLDKASETQFVSISDDPTCQVCQEFDLDTMLI